MDDVQKLSILKSLNREIGSRIDMPHDIEDMQFVPFTDLAQSDLSYISLEGDFGPDCVFVTKRRPLGRGNIRIRAREKVDNVCVLVMDRVPDLQRVILRGNGSMVAIGRAMKVFEVALTVGTNANLVVGDNISIHGATVNLNDGTLKIGKNCMFSRDINLYCAAPHAIVNLDEDRAVIREPRNETEIGDHVWLGARATVLLNSYIGQGSIVGADSCVRGRFKENCMIIGNPAVMVKESVTWSRSPTSLDDGVRDYLHGLGMALGE